MIIVRLIIRYQQGVAEPAPAKRPAPDQGGYSQVWFSGYGSRDKVSGGCPGRKACLRAARVAGDRTHCRSRRSSGRSSYRAPGLPAAPVASAACPGRRVADYPARPMYTPLVRLGCRSASPTAKDASRRRIIPGVQPSPAFAALCQLCVARRVNQRPSLRHGSGQQQRRHRRKRAPPGRRG